MIAGAGKTTLLECVSLRSREFRGAVHLNGRPARPTYFTQSGACMRVLLAVRDLWWWWTGRFDSIRIDSKTTAGRRRRARPNQSMLIIAPPPQFPSPTSR